MAGQPRITAEARARLVELCESTGPDGKYYTVRELEQILADEGYRVGKSTVQTVRKQVRDEQIGAIRDRVIDKASNNADDNLGTIERMRDALAHAASKGAWSDGMPCKGQVRVMAARDAVEAANKLLGYVGVRDDGSVDSDEVVSRVAQLYGLGTQDADEEEGHEDGEAGEPPRVPWTQYPRAVPTGLDN